MLFQSAVRISSDLDSQAEFLKRLLERAAVTAVFGLDLGGYIRWCGEGVDVLYGQASADCIGRHASTLWSENVGAAKSALEAALTTGKWEGNAPQQRRDGQSFSAHLTFLLRRDSNGRPRDVVAFSRDLSPLQRIDVELSASRAARATLVDSSAALLLLADFDGNVLSSSRPSQDVLGHDPARTHSTLPDLFVERQLVEVMLRETRRTEGQEDVALSLIQRNGRSVKVRCDTVVVRGGGENAGLLLAARPVVSIEPPAASPTRVVPAPPLGNLPHQGDLSARLRACGDGAAPPLQEKLGRRDGELCA